MGDALRTIEVITCGACLLGALGLAVSIIRDRTPGRRLLDLMLGITLLLVIHLVVGVVHVLRDADDVSVWEYVAYLVGTVLIVPIGVAWSSGEKSRGGTGVLLVAMLLVPFMFVRLADIWAAGG